MPTPYSLLFILLPLLFMLSACAGPAVVRPAEPIVASSSLTVEALIEQDAATRGSQLVRLAQAQLGRPYDVGGTGPGGFDCSGLVYYVHREAGIEVPRTSRGQFHSSRQVRYDDLLPGDLVFFQVSSRKISHVGIYVADDLFIHSPSTGKGVSYASLADDYWRERLVGAGRYH